MNLKSSTKQSATCSFKEAGIDTKAVWNGSAVNAFLSTSILSGHDYDVYTHAIFS